MSIMLPLDILSQKTHFIAKFLKRFNSLLVINRKKHSVFTMNFNVYIWTSNKLVSMINNNMS